VVDLWTSTTLGGRNALQLPTNSNEQITFMFPGVYIVPMFYEGKEKADVDLVSVVVCAPAIVM
jgi:hypothetical protein